jgi:hypothetical protein
VSGHSRSSEGEGGLWEGMRIIAIYHAEMAEQLTVLLAVVSSTTQSVQCCSPTKAFRVDVVNELVTELPYPVFMPKLSTHHMHDPGSNVPHIWPKVLADNQMS